VPNTNVKRASDPGYIGITELLVRDGDFFNIIGNQYAPIDTTVNHTVKAYIDNHIFATYTDVAVNAGGYFRIINAVIPAGQSSGKHTLKVTVLPEHISHSMEIFICKIDGKGCKPRLGFADSPSKHIITQFDGPTTLYFNDAHRLVGQGFPIPAGTQNGDYLGNATVWVDRTCFNKGPQCVEKGHLVTTTNLFAYYDVGAFGVSFSLLKEYLGPNSPHHLQAYANGREGEIVFKAKDLPAE